MILMNLNVIGSRLTTCLGLLYWDHEGKHVSILPVHCFSAFPLSENDAPWYRQCSGGKRAKAKKSARRVSASNSESEDLPMEEVPQQTAQGQVNEPTIEDIFTRRVSAPIAAHRCKARTYDLWQCSKTPVSGSPFCAIHTKHGSLRHGRVENPVPAWLRTDFLRTAHTRIKRGSKLEWYYRWTMWEFAEKLGKDCVEDLNDVEFIDGLHSVHTFFYQKSSISCVMEPPTTHGTSDFG